MKELIGMGLVLTAFIGLAVVFPFMWLVYMFFIGLLLVAY